MTFPNRRVLAALAALGTTAALGAGVAVTSSASAEPVASVSAQDQTFMTKAAQANLAEIGLARIAEKRTRSNAVRSFAHEMITDHKKLETALAAVAASKGVTLPTRPALAQRQIARTFGTARGSAFDCAYVPFQWDDHTGVLLLHETEVALGSDSDVKAAAAAAAPVIAMHLKMAAKLLPSVKSC